MPSWIASTSASDSGFLMSTPSTSAAKQGPIWRIVTGIAATSSRVCTDVSRMQRSGGGGPSPLWGEGRVRGGGNAARTMTRRHYPHPDPLPGREREKPLSQMGDARADLFHQEPQALVVPAGVVGVGGDRQQGAEAAALLVE